MGELKRKCGFCGEYFYIDKKNIDDAIYYGTKTYHRDCFISLCEKRSQSKGKAISEKWTNVLKDLTNIEKDSYKHFNYALVKDDIYDYIRQEYDITVIPTNVWTKIDSIYKGTYKGMSIGIPPEHLLDMWKKKMQSLNDIAAKNLSKGMKMNLEQRIKYDLSILINKYDSYLKWLEKQKILESKKENMNNDNNKIGINIINEKAKVSNDIQTHDSISEIVDDIFED